MQTNLDEQYLTALDKSLMTEREDIVAITYTTGKIDGTEAHAVRRTQWTSGNTTGLRPECNSRRQVRPASLGLAAEVTCIKCLSYARY